MLFFLLTLLFCTQHELNKNKFYECEDEKKIINLIFEANQQNKWTDPKIKEKEVYKIIVNDYQFEYIPDDISRFENVETIEINSNKFMNFSDEVGKLQKLTTMIFTINSLECLNYTIKNLKNIKEIYLIRNNGSVYSKNIDLDTLKNKNCQIIFKRESFQRLKFLKIFINFLEKDIKDTHYLNNFKYQPNYQKTEIFLAALCSIKNLHALTISDLDIFKIPKTIINLHNLTYLNLSRNQLSVLSEEICKIKNLDYLNLSNNLLCSLPESICKLKKLRTLHLANNHITCLPCTIGQLTNLEILNIKNHKLEYINLALSNLKNLKILNLYRLLNFSNSNICIKHLLLKFSNLNKLEELDLTNLNLERIHKSILKLKDNNIKIFIDSSAFENEDRGIYVGKKTLQNVFGNKIKFV